MLVLKRKVGEMVKIGDEIELHVLAVEGDVIKLGFEAPRQVQIMRSELYEAIRSENLQAGSHGAGRSEQLMNLLGGIKVLGSINRMDGANRDWSQLNAAVPANADRSPIDSAVTDDTRINTPELSEADKARLYKEVEKANEQLRMQNHTFRFNFSEEAEQFYVQVIDIKTQEVIESIPSEHMLELAAKLNEMIGFFIDKKG